MCARVGVCVRVCVSEDWSQIRLSPERRNVAQVCSKHVIGDYTYTHAHTHPYIKDPNTQNETKALRTISWFHKGSEGFMRARVRSSTGKGGVNSWSGALIKPR